MVSPAIVRVVHVFVNLHPHDLSWDWDLILYVGIY